MSQHLSGMVLSTSQETTKCEELTASLWHQQDASHQSVVSSQALQPVSSIVLPRLSWGMAEQSLSAILPRIFSLVVLQQTQPSSQFSTSQQVSLRSLHSLEVQTEQTVSYSQQQDRFRLSTKQH